MAVVGGGPAGSMAALTAAERGLSVLLVERDHVIGSPVRCAEGVDDRGLREFFEPRPEWIASEIDSYRLVSPDGTMVTIDTGPSSGYILERLVFDRMVAEKAVEAGARVMTGVEATGMGPFENGARTVRLMDHGRPSDIRASVVVAADGVESRTARWAGLATHAPLHDMLSCAQMTLSGIDFEPRAFRMYFTNRFAPGGYAWLFPKRGKTANVGLGVAGDLLAGRTALSHLEDFVSAKFPGASVVSRLVGGTPCTGGIKKIVAAASWCAATPPICCIPSRGGASSTPSSRAEWPGNRRRSPFEGSRVRARPHILRKTGERPDSHGKPPFSPAQAGILDIPDDRFDEMAASLRRCPVKR